MSQMCMAACYQGCCCSSSKQAACSVLLASSRQLQQLRPVSPPGPLLQQRQQLLLVQHHQAGVTRGLSTRLCVHLLPHLAAHQLQGERHRGLSDDAGQATVACGQSVQHISGLDMP
jgi:hypothetical protein